MIFQHQSWLLSLHLPVSQCSSNMHFTVVRFDICQSYVTPLTQFLRQNNIFEGYALMTQRRRRSPVQSCQEVARC